MKKDIKDVRRAISERKKSRGLPNKTRHKNFSTIMPVLPQDEEKHGYYPDFLDPSASNQRNSKVVTGIIFKGILSVMLFFSVAIVLQNDADFLSKPKKWAYHALTEEFPFASTYEWYKDAFGTPLAFSPNNEKQEAEKVALVLPVSGNVTETFQTNGRGIKIAPADTAPVSALRDGVVIFAGKDRNTKKTVVVQHADGTTSTYGYLSSIDVHLYQIIDAQQRIGEFAPSEDNETLYFAIEKDNEYIDPVQVVEVDDNP
ncbi:M23 family metallopeptidase [Ornithinibacillus bavariensis]|uniref:M23ase beta-sheet core domain-containing protein n=1 Tax=Ornithinibacillus bavariensis TaxID=545502 RepID=A0A920C7H3_9BACI|nr:M23 family metallopeptidase [Ornithinibacillus bavariensis]GIO27673.1 hypothetical protein J43TS3_22840 [Ornithinibacillus bavariensis]HAM81423.1 M23 family peptidase [Ornithinibacillus sp.]